MFAAHNAIFSSAEKVKATIKSSAVNSTQGTPVAIPTHSAGDLIVYFTNNPDDYSDMSPASGNTGWTLAALTNQVGTSRPVRCYYRIAASSSEVAGSWNNAYNSICVVISGQNATPIGSKAVYSPTSQTLGNTVSLTCPSVSLTNSTGSSILLHIATAFSINQIFGSSLLAGYTIIKTNANGVTDAPLRLVSKDDTTSDGSVTI